MNSRDKMGIDIYLRWDGFTKKDYDKQITGYNVTVGRVGYLREAYHGEPYATQALVLENWKKQPRDENCSGGFECQCCGFVIKNSTLKRRLPKVLAAATKRNLELYKGDMQKEVVQSFADFVALHGEKEKAGLHPRIIVSY